MDLDELERIAMYGGPMPDGLDLTDQWFFQSISLLYERYRTGFINREKGKKEKGPAGRLDQPAADQIFWGM